MSDPRRSSGFTAIELLAMLAALVVISSMAAVAVLPALRRGRVADAVNAIDSCMQEARLLARWRMAAPAAGAELYGVRLVASVRPQRAEVLYGERVLATRWFSPVVELWSGAQPATGDVTWRHQPATGYLVDAAGRPADIGAGAPGSPGQLSVRSVDGRYATAVAIYRIGLLSAEEQR